jgi:hypothetical protein
MGSKTATLALFMLVPAILITVIQLPRSLPLAKPIRALGLVCLAGTALAVLGTSSDFTVLHTVGIFLGAVPGFIGMGLASRAFLVFDRSTRWLGYLGLLTTFVGLSSVVGYALTLVGELVLPVLLPTSQKIALIGVVIWMLGVGWASHRTQGLALK